MKLKRTMIKRELEILEILKSVDRIDSEPVDLLKFLSNDSALALHGITDSDRDLIQSIKKNIQLLADFFDMNNLPWFSYDEGVFPVYANVFGVHTGEITVNWDSNYSIDHHLETLHDAMILSPKSIV